MKKFTLFLMLAIMLKVALATVTFSGSIVQTNSSSRLSAVESGLNLNTNSGVVANNFNSVAGTRNMPISGNAGDLSSVTFYLSGGFMSYSGAATITFDGTDYAYDNGLGYNTIPCTTGTHTYVVTPSNVAKAILRGTVDVPAIDDVPVALTIVNGYKVEIFTIDNASNPIEGASVTMNGQTITTDATGDAAFMRTASGSYTYSVVKAGYKSVAANPITVNTANVIETVTLQQPSVTFYLSGGFMSYSGAATITFDGTDYAYDNGLGYNTIPCTTGTHTYVVTPSNVAKAILRGTVDVPAIDDVPVALTIVNGYKVEIFTIDNASNPIEGASVTMNGQTIVTDATGDAVFMRTASGSYTYSVVKAGYKSVAANPITVNTANVIETVTLQQPSVTFYLSGGFMSYSGAATITFDGTDYAYDNGLGYNTIPCTTGTHTYVITPSNVAKAILRGTVDVPAIDDVPVALTIVNGYKVEIFTIDNASNPIEGASVTMNGQTIVTDATGDAVFMRTASGSYTYSVVKAGYKSVAANPITVNTANVIETVTLQQPSVTFYLSGGFMSYSGAATITFDGTDYAYDNGLGYNTIPCTTGTHTYVITPSNVAKAILRGTVDVPAVDDVPVALTIVNGYKVEIFTIDNASNPIEGASVTMNGQTITTDATGDAAFMRTASGSYTYSVVKAGYKSVAANPITVNTANVIETVTLQQPSVTFYLSGGFMSYSGAATITFDGTDYAYDNGLGYNTIPCTTGTHTYVVTPSNAAKAILRGTVDVPAIDDVPVALTIVNGYKVEIFTIDNASNPIEGASVTMNGQTIVTDATGDAVFMRTASGSYTYSVVKAGYKSVAANPITVNTANVIETVTLQQPSVTFYLSGGFMSYSGAATITFDGTDYAYDNGLGYNTIPCTTGTHTYVITPSNVAKAILRGTVDVPAVDDVPVALTIVNGYKVEIFTIDNTSNPIEGASVTMNGQTIVTDASGDAVFMRTASGSYPYSVAKTGYGTVTGTAALGTADLVVTAVLVSETAYKVTVTVYDNSSTSWPPAGLQGATVIFNGNTVVTDADGIAILPDEPNGAYDYTVIKEGFVTVKGTAYIADADAMVYVNMKPAYSVQFTVTDGTNPVASASVKLVSGWPVFDQTFITDAQGVLLTDKLFPKWTSLDYTISAAGFADATGTANIQDVDLVVDPIVLQRAFEITLTVNDGTNPLMDASVKINNTVIATNASGIAVFPKMINGDYAYVVSKLGFSDVSGTVAVMDANAAKTISLAVGYNLTFNVINGNDGTVGLANDTITINGISKVTDASGIIVFGVAPGSAISFVNKKAGFVNVPVEIASVTSDLSQTINMVPVYNVAFRAIDNYTYNPIAGATVIFNGTTVNTDIDGYAYFTNMAPSADAYGYTVSGNGSYTTVTGAVILPFTSTEDLLMNNNNVTVSAELSSPGVYLALVSGMMTYFGQATINLDGTDYAYDPGLGSVVINCSLGTHSYIVTPEDVNKAIVRGSVTVTSTTEKTFVEVKISAARKIEIYTINAASDPIEGASVTLSGNTVLTDATGLALFDRYPAGNYTYTITKANYKSVDAASLDVNTSDVMKVVTMEPLVYSVTFNVKSGIEILVGAVVTLDGLSVNTDASGNAVFTGIPMGTYSYTVTKAGTYKDESGSITVTNADITENVDLINTTGIGGATTKAIKLYPNPTSGILNINLPENNGKEVTIRVTNIVGAVLLTNKVVNGSSQIKLDVSGFDNGIYFVTLKGSGFENTMKVVKN